MNVLTVFRHLIFLICSLAGFTSLPTWAQAQSLEAIKASISETIKTDDLWLGPQTGPSLINNKRIVFVASDLRNDGVNLVAKGMTQALQQVNWNMRLLDGHGSKVRQAAAINQAITLKPDGIVLGGIDAAYHLDSLAAAAQLGITVIGWHAADNAGPAHSLHLFTNITTDAEQVGQAAAHLAVADSNGRANVVIFTDNNYSIAALKARSMAQVIEDCEDCKLLSIENVSLDNVSDEMPAAVARLHDRYGDQITHFLVINDLYIDYAIPTLNHFGAHTKNISAGDGSREAYQRIRSKQGQLATVPEPLSMQGWQIVDEFNRAFNGLEDSGFLAPVHIIVKENIQHIQAGVYDPSNGYRSIYKRIWQ